MRAIFLTDNTHILPRVFTEATYAELSALLEFDEKAYTGADLTAAADSFSDVEMIFSTWGMPMLSATEIRAYLPRLKCIFYAAGSVQRFARPFLECGVRVFSAWAANAVPVAELTAAEIVLANKGYFSTARTYAAEGRNAARDAFGNYPGNLDETVGIIGAGMIGRKVIELLRQYRLNVAVFDPFLPDEAAAELGVTKCSLEELFEGAMTVSNHLANNAATRGMITYDHFRRMRKCATFINTGRGAQVVHEDLVRILTERPDLTALLDVTTPEPLPEGHVLLSLPNCIVTPHIAGSAGNELARMGEYMLAECRAYLAGEVCRYEINEKMLETMA